MIRKICLGLFLFVLPLHGGGLQLSEVAVPALGFAGVGQSAWSEDPSTAYFNAAGMTRICGNQLLIGTQFQVFDTRFQKKSTTTFPNAGDATQIGLILGGLGAYYVYSFNDCLKAGLSINSPYGTGLNYKRHWTGRYIVQDLLMLTFDFNPSVAYKINRWISIGGGFVAEYGRLNMSVAINPSLFGGTPGVTSDGRISLDFPNWAYGWNAGILMEPCSTTRIGVAYRSRLHHNFTGKAHLSPVGVSFGLDTDLVFPQNVVLSLYQKISFRWAILADFGWNNYKIFKSQVIASDNGGEIVIPRNWKNIWHFGLAAEYFCSSRLILQTGFSYDTSPTRYKFRTPDFPVDRQYRIGVGVIYKCRSDIRISTAFEYLNLGSVKMGNPIVQGYYNANSGCFLNFTVQKTF